MELYNAMDLLKGKRAETNKMSMFSGPLQFLPREEKDEPWTFDCMDFIEFQGIRQLRRNAPRLMKNFKLAVGEIDRDDYVLEENNEYRDIVDILSRDEPAMLELKFCPLIPNVINTLCTEFSERNTEVAYRAVDERSLNEKADYKLQQVTEVLIADAQKNLINSLLEQGLDPNDPEVQQIMQQSSSVDALKQLPYIQKFFNKDYRSICVQWAAHQHQVDVERFRMDELEERNFRNMLITDREFWHFRMFKDDYEVEIWNPVLTFYHKSPEARYISQGNWVGKIEMMTASDAIDKYGTVMTYDQMKAVESIYPIRGSGYPIQGLQNDGSYYDATRSHDWNTKMPGLAYRQFTSMTDLGAVNGGDIVNWIMGENEDFTDMSMAFMLRVTTIYWKSQRKVGYLTKVKDSGEVVTDIVDESYKVTDKPIYDTTLFKTKGVDNLLFGEHIEWIWINEVWGGVKIGPNRPSFWGMTNTGGPNPIYIGIDKNRIGPLRFQFRGDKTLYGCKLPVEGRVFNDYNTKSRGIVDHMKPFQIGANLTYNQVMDILVDELGTIIMFDQNALPQHSLGEDWGKNNLAKAYTAMKQFGMFPLDTGLSNTEHPIANQAFQSINLEQSTRLMTRIQLFQYFKQQAFEVIGITPQRMGQQTGAETAEGIRLNQKASYAQTEMLFVQHSDQLMPRVHQMRTDLAQFYQSYNPSIRLQWVTSKDEEINFEINGTDLLLRDINVSVTTKATYRKLIEKFKLMVEGDRNSGASLFDRGAILQANSLAEIDTALKMMDERVQKEIQGKMDHEKQMQQMEIEAREREQAIADDRKEIEAEKDRRKDILVAEIRAAGYGAMQDMDANKRSDYLDFLDQTRKTQEYQDSVNFEQQKEMSKQKLNDDKQRVQREKMQTQLQVAQMKLEESRINKNRFDVPSKESKKK